MLSLQISIEKVFLLVVSHNLIQVETPIFIEYIEKVVDIIKN